jgi:polyribonucleotide nucleotidyltransferase
LIDRSIRPLFPEFYRNDIQVVTTVLSVDEKNTPEVLGLLGASLALGISEIPFEGPIGACRIGLLDKDNFIINPSLEQLVSSRLDMVIAGSEEGITMIEAGAKEVSEADITQALRIGYEFILKTIQTQKAIISQWGKTKKEFEIPAYFSEIEDWIRNNYHLKIADKIAVFDKSERQKNHQSAL